MSVDHLTRRVDALRRKMALALVVVELQPAAEEVCDRWAIAEAEGQPLPSTRSLVDVIVRRRPGLPSLMGLYTFLNGCRANGEHPLPHRVLRSLLPWHAVAGYLGPRL